MLSWVSLHHHTTHSSYNHCRQSHENVQRTKARTYQDGDGEHELVGCSDGAAEVGGSYLWQVHGTEAGIQPVIDADDETGGDQHLVGGGHLAEPEENGSDEGEGVIDEEATLASEPGEEEGQRLDRDLIVSCIVWDGNV